MEYGKCEWQSLSSKKDLTDNTKIGNDDDSYYSLKIVDDHLFYISETEKEDEVLYKSDLNGKNKTALYNDSNHNGITVIDNELFFDVYEDNDNYSVIKMKTDGSYEKL